MEGKKVGGCILGLDIGANSIGWAMLSQQDGKPTGIIKTGVRVFEAATEGDISAGKDESRNKKRRQMRLQRRQAERRARRKRKVFNLLVKSGLLPSGPVTDVINKIDKAAYAKYVVTADKSARPILAHVVPYILRARALDHPLSREELGRALYHLCQRRGYKSNARMQEDEKEKGEVKQGIGKLEQAMTASGARTLGEHFSKLNPEEERIRQRWTSREMYENEFEQIWEAQKKHSPELLTDALKAQVRDAIFHQRKITWDKNTIGDCELEPGHKRAPAALLLCQRFRMLQNLNNLEIISPLGEVVPLTPEQRHALAEKLDVEGDLSWTKARKILNLTKQHHFNLEQASDKGLIGNRTAGKLYKIFGDKWLGFTDEQKNQIVEDVRSYEDPKALVCRAMKIWQLHTEKAAALAAVAFEPDYFNLSLRAITKLLPLLENGARFAAARDQIYGKPKPAEPVDSLPVVNASLPALRNPVVARCLTELRKVVNNILRDHGKPAMIRVELARDIKRSKKQRHTLTERIRGREKLREDARKRLENENLVARPTRNDIDKVLLADECNWICPYTGRQIGWKTLFGATPQFDIEHIIPFSRCLDDSLGNKTLCDIEENRNVKRNRTPWEAYGSNPERWNQILHRVKNFKGDDALFKLQRFQLKDVEDIEEFSSRQLNDTRYASVLAAKYLGALYGGAIDAEHTRKIQVSTGMVTAYLRNEYGMNSILGDGGEKSRDDHRHHAIDAICVALTGPAAIKMLTDAASRAPSEHRRQFGRIDPPWASFLADVRKHIDNLNVSHAVSRKVNGPLHDETLYTKPRADKDGNAVVCVRKPIDALSEPEAKQIIDPVIRKMVLERLEKEGAPPKKVFADKSRHPVICGKNGTRIPVHSVRIAKTSSVISIGQEQRQRHVMTGSNHHMEIIETPDGKWRGQVVSTYEAMRRLARHEPIVSKTFKPGEKFKFSLCGGDTIELDEDGAQRRLYRIRSIDAMKTGAKLKVVPIEDARKANVEVEGKKIDIREPISIKQLRERNSRKVIIDPLGRVRYAND